MRKVRKFMAVYAAYGPNVSGGGNVAVSIPAEPITEKLWREIEKVCRNNIPGGCPLGVTIVLQNLAELEG